MYGWMFEEPKMEKLTTNLPPVEIARMDMLIEAGYYSSRAEFIRAAIRERLDSHQDFISKKLEQMAQGAPEESKDKEIAPHAVVLGVLDLDNTSLESAIKQGKMMKIRVAGMLRLSEDVRPELIERAVDSVKVWGIVRGSEKAKKALQSKIKKGV